MFPEKYGPQPFNPWRFLNPSLTDTRPLYYFDIYDLKYILPECFLFISLLLLLLFGSFKFHNTKTQSNVLLTGRLLVIILILTTFLLLDNFVNNRHAMMFYEFLAVENFTTFAKICVILLTVSLLFSAKQYVKQNNLNEYDYLLVLGLTTGGLFIVLSANDFMALLLAIELVSYGLYTLANIKKNSALATESAIKYYITGILATGLYAFGASLVYIQTKTLNFFVLNFYIYRKKMRGIYTTYNPVLNDMDFSGPNYTLLLFGITLMLILLLFKIAAAPFHVWSPDVYEGAPMLITAYYAIVVKFTMLIVFIKTIRFVLSDFIHIFRPGLIFVVICSLLIGSIGASYQDRLKRVFAYSSISHVGYILMGLIPFTDTGFTASLVYTFIYTLGNVVLFNFLLSTNVVRLNDESVGTVVVSDLAKVGRSSPLLSVHFSCALFSFAGIPPFAGFFAKLGIFYALVERGYGTLVLIGFISTAISCFYYLKMVKSLFFVSTEQVADLIVYDRFKEMLIFWLVVFLSGYFFIAYSFMLQTKLLFLSYFTLFLQ